MARAEAIIDLGALEYNIKRLLSNTKADALAVVKADAYGHGLVPVAERALKAGAKWLGTALLEEAVALRDAGITAPTIAWLTPVSDDFESALKKKIDLAIPSLDHLDAVIKAGKSLGISPRVHLEVDTGMSRGGALKEWSALISRAGELSKSGGLEVVGIWSHFARADEPNHSFNEEQLHNFRARVSEAREVGISPKILHLSNSAAALTNESSHFDLVRLGIAMYGLSPDVKSMGGSESLNLKPVMKLRARLHIVKDVPAGSQVGYGGTATTKTDTKLAVVAMGYADGVPRNANSSAGVLVGNKKAPIIGRVSMDQFVVEIGNDSIAHAGDWAYLIGSEGGDGYTADAWAEACGTINYEIVTRIGPRVPRVFTN
ncbi:MAG: alanine racemase [Candidatus Nanopelagicaceae bacterium]|nr:alanine racemase [Candidatus Nanopelagicaceae bacterium]